MNELSLRVPNEVHITKKKKPKTQSTLDPHSGEGPERKKQMKRNKRNNSKD